MDNAPTDTGSATPVAALSRLTTAACWVFGSMMIIGGLLKIVLAGGWLNDQIGGALTSAAGLCLLPPILRRIRSKAPWSRPVWVPVVWFAFVAMLLPVLLTPLAPSPAEQARQRTAAIAAAEQHLAQGDFAGARLQLYGVQRRPDPDGQVAALNSRIDRAVQAANAARRQGRQGSPRAAEAEGRGADTGQEAGYPDPAAVYAERVQTYWLPQVSALSGDGPQDIAAYNQVLTSLEGLRANVAEGEQLDLSPAQRAVHERFSTALAAKQRSLFPVLRRRYAELLDAQLFRSDVRVTASGSGARTLRLTGPMFVRNANIQDMQTGLASDLARARFRRVEFRWSPRVGGVTYYDLEPPPDGDVANR